MLPVQGHGGLSAMKDSHVTPTTRPLRHLPPSDTPRAPQAFIASNINQKKKKIKHVIDYAAEQESYTL